MQRISWVLCLTVIGGRFRGLIRMSALGREQTFYAIMNERPLPRASHPKAARPLTATPRHCFLEIGDGDEIGLIVPADVSFDGRRMIGGLRTQEGKPMVWQVGQLVTLTGPVLKNARDGRYSCDTAKLHLAD